MRQTEAAITECRAKRLNGELKSYVASVRCSTPRIVQAFSAARYRYIDLIAVLNSGRLKVAERLDRREITEAQAQSDNTRLFSAIVEAERQRDAGR
jgi:hypothetical protein